MSTISLHNRLQRPHLRLHVIFDVDLVGFFGEHGRLEVVVEDDVDVCDGAFFRALIQDLSRGIGSNQRAIDPIVFSGHPLDKRTGNTENPFSANLNWVVTHQLRKTTLKNQKSSDASDLK